MKKRPDPHKLLEKIRAAKPVAKSDMKPFRTPSFAEGKRREIAEVELNQNVKVLVNRGHISRSVRRFKMEGGLNILVENHPENGWHLSISHPTRNPTWDEIAEARYRLVPDSVTMGLVLPPRSEYVNLHKHCFQVSQVYTRDQIEREIGSAAMEARMAVDAPRTNPAAQKEQEAPLESTTTLEANQGR